MSSSLLVPRLERKWSAATTPWLSFGTAALEASPFELFARAARVPRTARKWLRSRSRRRRLSALLLGVASRARTRGHAKAKEGASA